MHSCSFLGLFPSRSQDRLAYAQVRRNVLFDINPFVHKKRRVQTISEQNTEKKKGGENGEKEINKRSAEGTSGIKRKGRNVIVADGRLAGCLQSMDLRFEGRIDVLQVASG